jgi:tRNA(Ile)-lysidine synthase
MRVAVAVSGGRDSLALLHATLQAARPVGIEVLALHVHHGLQADADMWARHVESVCRRWRVACVVERLKGAPRRGDSVEAWARRERYAALARMAKAAGATLVLLAHHRRDQAETFVLQALRGAGAAGLAAMPRLARRDDLSWARPWLAVPREAIEAYARRHRLKAVDDPSNHDPRFARSHLRSQVWPALVAAFPYAEAAFAETAARAAENREALGEIAAHDLAQVADERGLKLAAWQALPIGRRRVALQHWLQLQTGQGAPQALVARLLAEAAAASTTASWAAGGGSLRRYRGRLTFVCDAPLGLSSVVCMSIHRAGRYAAPGGTLVVRRVVTGGVPLALLHDCELRPRPAGARFQRAASTPARSLKKQFQAAGLPAWQRDAPLLYAGEQIVFVPGLGIDARAQALAGTPRVTIDWEPGR